MIHCAVFDMDGTLIDSRMDLVNTCNEFRETRNLAALPPEQVITYVGDGCRKLLERTLADTDIQVTDEVFAEFLQYYTRNLTVCTTLYPGVREGFCRLLEYGWKLAVFSNKRQDFCEKILSDFHVLDMFDIIIGDGSSFPKKPDPTALKHILNTLHVSHPEQSWMVGDHHTDLQSGINAGMKTAFCEYGIGEDGGLVPDIRIRNFSEFIREVI